MNETVTDINGIHYQLGEELGSGGQGKVFRCTNDSRRAIKIFETNSSSIDRVRRLQLNNEMFIVPEIPLADNNGYVMELLEDGMQSLEDIFWNPLKEHEFSPEWFAATGGLEKRYKILAKIADALHLLHSNGLIYKDISLKNIFVSANPSKSAVCFIDCDNVAYDTDEARQLIGTPGFIPPEFYNRKHYGSLSEVFSFAVLAFMILRTEHPFRGVFYRENPPDIFDEKYKTGTLPYIDDPNDRSNYIPGLFPVQNVFSERLQEMFYVIFGKNLCKPLKRQNIAVWRDIFQILSNRLVKCPKCGNHYLYPRNGCPWCAYKESSDFLNLNIVVYDEWVQKYIADFYEEIGRALPAGPDQKQTIRQFAEAAFSVRKKNRKAPIPFLTGQTRKLDFSEIIGLPPDQSLEITYRDKTMELDNRTDFPVKLHETQQNILPGRKNKVVLPDKGKAMQMSLALSPEQKVILLFTLQ